MTLTNFALKDQRSGTGPVTFAVRSSRDGFAADLLTLPTPAAGVLARNEIARGAGRLVRVAPRLVRAPRTPMPCP